VCPTKKIEAPITPNVVFAKNRAVYPMTAGHRQMESRLETNEEVKTFLLKHRAQVSPTEYGFPVGRRRVNGLRREEVAQLAAISVSWYTWLEQGRDISVSPEAIKRIGRVLKLSSDEQEHFEAIVFGHCKTQSHSEKVSPELKAIVDQFGDNPAFIRRENMDIVYWNEAALRKVYNWAKVPESERNSLKLMFLCDEYKTRIPHWETAARNTIASFRSYFALSENKAIFETVIDNLKHRSTDFDRMWAEYEIKKIGRGKKSVYDDQNILRHYQYTALKPIDIDDLFLMLFTEVEE
jgi:transcriptional regulator with XRE-family HTH domain